MSGAIRRKPGTPRRREQRSSIDWALLLTALGLLAFGFVMVASASMSIAEGRPFYYVNRHAIALTLALTGGYLAYRIPLEIWERAGVWLLLGSLIPLIMVLLPGLGLTVKGAARWIPLGPFTLQPAEFVKLFVIVYVAGYLVRHAESVASSLSGFVRPLLLIGMVGFLILEQPDFGTTAIILATTMGMLFLGGASLLPFIVMLGGVLAGLVMLILTSPYRLERLLSFLNPFADAFDTGYQLSQALIAFGRGEWFGVGLGNGIQKQFFLPEAHTDFVAAVVGEEFGLLGMLLLIAAFAFLTWRAFDIGSRAMALAKPFAGYLAQGIGLSLGLQAFINLSVNVGLLPTKGLTLPFLSYGSNSLIVVCLSIGLLLQVDTLVRQLEAESGTVRGGRWARA